MVNKLSSYFSSINLTKKLVINTFAVSATFGVIVGIFYFASK